MAKVIVTEKEIKQVLKNWIDELPLNEVKELYDEYFDEPIHYDWSSNKIEMSVTEAKRVGIV